MKEIKIENVLTNERLNDILLPKSRDFVNEDKLARVEDAVSRIVRVVLNNKIKALEIGGITYNLEISYLDPVVIGKKKEEKIAKAKEDWDKMICEIMEDNLKLKENIISGEEKELELEEINIVIDALKQFSESDIVLDLEPETDARIDKNAGNTIVDVVINIDNPDHENTAAQNAIKTIFEDSLNRLFCDSKLKRGEKSEAQGTV